MTTKASDFDFVIIGGGIIGLSVARALKHRDRSHTIRIVEKESSIAQHASGRNSGVLHAGFYYTADSFKARFAVDGNRMMKQYCIDHCLPVNSCGKLVVAADTHDISVLKELQKRGEKNGAEVHLISLKDAEKIEPNIQSVETCLWSPNSATVDPKQVCEKVADEIQSMGVSLQTGTTYVSPSDGGIATDKGTINARHVINCAGLFADRVGRDFGFSRNYKVLPFKGLYLKYTENTTDVSTNIYPVPHPKNPFLGVHFTKTVSGAVKIGPTAVPALWRENYGSLSRFSLKDFFEIAGIQAKLALTNSFGFRDLALEEVKKYRKQYMVSLAVQLVKHIARDGFTEYGQPGIRAQLIDVRTDQLVQDFVIEGDRKSTHILNAVSPAFTCAFSFAEYIVEQVCAKVAGKNFP